MTTNKECCGKCITISRIVPEDGNIDACTNEECNCHIPQDTEEWEKEFYYLLFNHRQAIKHEMEGTNIGPYKNGVEEHTMHLLNFIRTQIDKAREETRKAAFAECVEMVREMKNENEGNLYKYVNANTLVSALQDKMK